MIMKSNTSWGNVAEWYDEMLETSEDSYQKNVILPNVLRILNIEKGTRILDLACGQGFFSRAFADAGAQVIGVDASHELIALAKKYANKKIIYRIAPADKLDFFADKSFDAAIIILAIQNMKHMANIFSVCSRVLAPSGKLILVMNHPAFRIPKRSSWGWDAVHKAQYRRVDGYLTESAVGIDMHPGKEQKETTISFHRPLQTYVNALSKNNFAVTRMEEWISHRQSQKGPRQIAEDRSRKEIPLFLMIEGRKFAF